MQRYGLRTKREAVDLASGAWLESREEHLERLRRAVLGRCELVAGHGLADHEQAAAPLLHADPDFDEIARHCDLRTA